MERASSSVTHARVTLSRGRGGRSRGRAWRRGPDEPGEPGGQAGREQPLSVASPERRDGQRGEADGHQRGDAGARAGDAGKVVEEAGREGTQALAAGVGMRADVTRRRRGPVRTRFPQRLPPAGRSQD